MARIERGRCQMPEQHSADRSALINVAGIPGQASPSSDEQRLRDVQLELLEALDSVCDRLGLTYVAVAGTALGAVRHSGFIPWDDDLDIAMPRADFDCFVRDAPQCLDERYFLQHRTTDSHFALPMAKLRRNGSRFVQQTSRRVDAHDGIFIDVFPVDATPRSERLRGVHAGLLDVLSRIARLRCGYELPRATANQRLFASALRIALTALPPRAATWALDFAVRLGSRGRGALTIVGGTYGYRREWFDQRWFEGIVRIPFERTTVPVFSEVDDYLARLYGDYHQPPPPELRNRPHPTVALEFPTPIPTERIRSDG